MDRKTAVQVVRAKLAVLKTMHDRAEDIANRRVGEILGEAHKQADHTINIEINRLKALSKVNPNVREDEIAYYRQQLDALSKLIDNAGLRLEAVRVIVVTR